MPVPGLLAGAGPSGVKYGKLTMNIESTINEIMLIIVALIIVTRMCLYVIEYITDIRDLNKENIGKSKTNINTKQQA